MSRSIRLRALACVIAPISLSGCLVPFGQIKPEVEDGVAKKAVKQFEFMAKCPAPEVRTQYLSNKELGVEGCGQRAIYLLLADGKPRCFPPDKEALGMASREKLVDHMVDRCVPVLSSESTASDSAVGDAPSTGTP